MNSRCRILLAAIPIALIATSALAQPITFDGPREYVAGARAIAAGDFSGDRRPDIVAAYSEIHLLREAGDGTFAAPRRIHPGIAGAQVAAMVTGHFDSDSNLDVAAAVDTSPQGTVLVLLGNGDGTFRVPASYAVADRPAVLIAVDINGDRIADLATADARTAALSVLLGNADGVYQAAASYAVPRQGGRLVLAGGDYNGDSYGDIAAGGSGISVLLGDESGVLKPGATTSFDDSSAVIAMQAADFNEDNTLDLMMGRTIFLDLGGGIDVTELYLGNPDGTFTVSSSGFAMSSTGVGSLTTVAVTDVDQDGHQDAFFAGVLSLTMRLGNGDGTFDEPFQESGAGGSNLLFADFNGDTHPDLAMSAGPTLVRVRLGAGDGTLHTALKIAALPANSQEYYRKVIAADFNNDGKSDVAAALHSPNTGMDARIEVRLGNGDGTFRPPVSLNLASAAPALDLLTGDFNNDARGDLLVQIGADGAPRVVVFLGNGNGTFQLPRVTTTGVNPNFYGGTVGDFNSDARLDLAFAMNGLTGDFPGALVLMFGRGNGRFDSPVLRRADVFGPKQVVAADFNGDLRTDLAITNTGTETTNSFVTILLSNGNGTFVPRWFPLPSSVEARLLATGELNGDSRPDLVVSGTNASSDIFLTFLGNGDGTFHAKAYYPVWFVYVPQTVAYPVIADFDGDERGDVATLGFNTSSAAMIWKGNGDGTLAPGPLYHLAENNGVPLVADLTGDGKPDLAAGGRAIHLLVNTSPVAPLRSPR